MIFNKVKTYGLVFDFLQSRTVYPFYSGIYDVTSSKFFTSNSNLIYDHPANTIHLVNYIPPFLKPQLSEERKSELKVITDTFFHGFMADLTNSSDLNEYLMKKMSSKSRTKMRSYVRKLEACYDISYKLYFGEIEKSHYDFLFSKFQGFLRSRFLQRGDSHELLPHWRSIEDDSYQMIKNKTASLFVIYNGEEPIDICLNYHFGNVFHNAIRSYNIAYSKFRLGYIDIMKQLDWCFANNIHLFDLGTGDMDYKRLWCNVVYDFERQIICSKDNLQSKVIAYGLIHYLRIKASLKKRNFHKVYHFVRKLFNKKKGQQGNYLGPRFEILPDRSYPKDQGLTLLNLEEESNKFLRKPICDFQFSYLETLKDLELYKMDGEKDMYFIKGKNNMQQFKVVS